MIECFQFTRHQLTLLAVAEGKPDLVSAHTVVGWAGQCISVIDKTGDGGGNAYWASLAEARAFVALAADAGTDYGVSAVVLTHGECDALNTDYENELAQLIGDYNQDLPAITHQTTKIFMVLSQQNTKGGNGLSTNSAFYQWRAGVDYPGQIVCSGPKYQYWYYTDHLHLTNVGYIRLGEKTAEVIDALARGIDWRPVQPNSVARSGNTVLIGFDVPNPPLQWDPNLAQGHLLGNTFWADGGGFEAYDGDSGVPLAIAEAAIVDAGVVKLTLGQPTTGPITVGYALSEDLIDAGTLGGLPTGRHGELRDSDAFVGADLQTLTVSVVNGSAVVTGSSDAFLSRDVHDLASASGLPPETVVETKTSDTSLTLSHAWTGATGEASIQFWHEQRNYAVSFRLNAP